VSNPAVSKAGKVRPYWNFSETGSDLIGVILPLLLTNILYSQNPLSTLSWSLHFLLYLSFALSLRRLLDRRPEQSSSRDAEGGRRLLTGILTVSLLFQTVLAATQVYLGHSVGGIMYYLGERMVSVGAPGIALGSFMDQVALRAYGTFSHPNVLAGYAVISYLILIQICRTAIPKVNKQRDVRGSDQLRRSWPAAKMFSRLQNTSWRPGQILWVPLIPVALIVLLTQSRSAALTLFGIIIPFYFIKNIKYSLIYLVVILSTTYYLPSLVIPTRSDLSSSGRLTLQSLSLSVIRSFPVFGTGVQSSISTYPQIDSSVRFLQPDHNSFTLFLSWFGVFGVFAVIFSATKRSDLVGHPTRSDLKGAIEVMLPILPLLLFDHYLLTSPQGMFVLVLYLSTCSPVLNYSHAQKNR
jgi:hypothetical protein